jgi:hypothetical protein
MKAHGGMWSTVHSYVTSVTHGEEQLASHCSCFIPSEVVPGTLWVVLKSSLERLKKTNSPAPISKISTLIHRTKQSIEAWHCARIVTPEAGPLNYVTLDLAEFVSTHCQAVATDAQWQLVAPTPMQHYILTFQDIYRNIHSESLAL